MKALILAGGFGTRLKTILGDVPKPMISVAGKPFLEHQINFLKDQGITEIILAIHYMADQIKSYFGSGLRWKVDITYSEEDIPLGTGGAIKKAGKYIDDTFLVLNGDSYSQIDVKELLNFHMAKRGLSTMCLTKINDSSHFGNVVLEENKIISFSEKSQNKDSLVNRGIYLFEPRILDYIPDGKRVSLENEIFPILVGEGLLYGYRFPGYFMDIGRPETYKKFKEQVLSTLLLRDYHTVGDALKKIGKSEINIILVVDDNTKLLGVLTERIIRKFLLAGGDLKENITKAMITNPITVRDDEPKSKINDFLQSGINSLPILDWQGRVVDVEFRGEMIRTESFLKIGGRAPLRISFSGGGTDIPYFFEKYGGAVINATINKYCYATVCKRADKKIIIDSDAIPKKDALVYTLNDLKYDANLDLVKAVIKKMNLDFGVEIFLHNDVPPGRGLGSSASLAVLLISLLSYLQGKNHNDRNIADIAYRAEREELLIKGGWQDQYAAASGGFNFMEFNRDKNIIYPLRLKREVVNELNSRLLLCYVGKSHDSGEVHDTQEQSFINNEQQITESLEFMKDKAIKIRDCLLSGELEPIGGLLHSSWEKKRQIGKVSNQRIDEIYEAGMKSGAIGGKLIGAGNGGYLLFFHSPSKRNQITRALEKIGCEVMNFGFESKGVEIWKIS